MRICLIIPPSPFLLDERVFMHIGILKVAAVLEQRGYGVDVLDLAGIENYKDVIREYIKTKLDVGIFGITATTPQIPYAIQVARTIRMNLYGNESYIILGGTHVSLMHTAAKREKDGGRATEDMKALQKEVDTIVAGDGEFAIFEALETQAKLVDADDKNSPYFLSNEDFSELPMPARHLVDVGSYNYTIEGHNAVSLIGQLGCPFRCTFCGGRNSPFLRKIRTRSTDSVVQELRYLYNEYGFTGFMFYDDELNVNKGWVELLKGIIDLQDELGEEFRLRGFVKAELFTAEQASLMYKAGFRWLLPGFESGDERILTNIDKIATREDNTRCARLARDAGLKIKALMSIGHAGESVQSIENTKNWLLEIQPEEFDCTIITPYPGSPYFDDAKEVEDGIYQYKSPKTGDIQYQRAVDYLKQADYYKGDPDGGYKSYVWTPYISRDNLVIERDKLEAEVREKLGIPFNRTGTVTKFEHSMGQGLPERILKSSDDHC